MQMTKQRTDPRYGQAFVGKEAAVASPNNLATVVGNNILQQGGNAIDAMVAVNTTLSVVFPHMTGAGGDAFWLIYDAASKKQYALNASGRSAATISAKAYEDRKKINERGPLSAITVPGAVDGWYQAHQKFGSLPFADCLQPAIRYARNGFPANDSVVRFSESSLDLLRTYDSTANAFLKDGVAPYLAGETMKNPALAETLEKIAQEGRDVFYEGDISKRIVQSLQAQGGYLTEDDFRKHQSVWEDPLEVTYHGKTVSAPPPNSDGMATLQILGMLDQLDTEHLHDDQAAFIDLFTRATALAFKDRNEYLDDPDFTPIPTDQLLSEEYLRDRSKKLDQSKMAPPEEAIQAEGDTTFSCAVDQDGNAVAVIQSLYWEWGSGFVPDDTGILLQNRGSFFSLDPEDRNQLEPGKRPGHTLTCSIVCNEDGPELLVGAMGGDGQPQTQATLISRILDQAYSVQEAIDEPRWLLGRTWGEAKNGLRLEGRYPKEMIEQLENYGHEKVELIEDYSDLVGHAQAIQIFPDRIEAGADPRSNGLALGY